MIKLFTAIILAIGLISCNENDQEGKLIVSGEIKNAPDQKIYLEELFFTQKDPVVLDTAEIKNGKFKLNALAPEEGIYRLRLEKSEAPFIFINDKNEVNLSTDYSKLSLENIIFNTPANHSLRKFITALEKQRNALEQKTAALQQYPKQVSTDSIFNEMQKDYEQQLKDYQEYALKFLDTTSDPVVAAFTLSYARDAEPARLEKVVGGLATRFPGNQSISALVAQHNQELARSKAIPGEGSMAPDINMPDTNGKAFALSMLKGKYVLVDFWASWCGPCRGENPNVVKAYNKFKDKNFTILGVSLDREKAPWLKAIADDQLTWHHISDLQYWNSAAVALYGFEGIPFNVLVNPEGKIIATNLRGSSLETRLSELIK